MEVPKCLEIDVLYVAIHAQRTIQSSCIVFQAIPIENNYGYEHFICRNMESSLTCEYGAVHKPPPVQELCEIPGQQGQHTVDCPL